MSPRWYLIQDSLINSRIIYGLPPVQWLLTWGSVPPQNYKLFFLPHRLNSFPPALVSSLPQLLGTLTYSTGLCCWWIFVVVALFPLLSSYGGGKLQMKPRVFSIHTRQMLYHWSLSWPCSKLKTQIPCAPRILHLILFSHHTFWIPNTSPKPIPSGLGSKPSSLSWNHNQPPSQLTSGHHSTQPCYCGLWKCTD